MINFRHIAAVGRGVFLELVRRKDLGVAALFAGLYMLFVAAARFVGFDNPATGTFLLNLSLTLIVGLCHLVTLTTAARQFPDEFERRTLYPLLARPIRRADVLLGKWGASTAAGILLFGALVILVLLLVPRLESYENTTLLQFLALQPVALAMTAALGVQFSLLFPRLPGLFLAAALVFGSGHLTRFARGMPVFHLLPNPNRMNLTLRYTDGIAPLPGFDFLLLLAYGFLWTGVLIWTARVLFQRRRI